ncbi:hypothetical protein ACFL6C_14090, partial [Myxococcota bacterium]
RADGLQSLFDHIQSLLDARRVDLEELEAIIHGLGEHKEKGRVGRVLKANINKLKDAAVEAEETK